jgi:hypothetical protein
MRIAAFLTFALLAASTVGCGPTSPAPGVPAGAELLMSDYSAPVGLRGDGAAKRVAETNGALYVFDVTANAVAYSGPVLAGEPVRIYPGGVTVTRVPRGRRTPEEQSVARFEVGRVYRAYFHQNAAPVNPTPDPRVATTLPFQERQRVIDPTERQGPPR